MFDKDGDGVISMTELRHVMSNIGEELTEEELDDILKDGDLDGDGTIVYEGTYNKKHICSQIIVSGTLKLYQYISANKENLLL